MEKWTPSDVIVTILACVVAATLFAAIIKPFITTNSLPEESAKMVAGLIGSLISLISMYIGAKIQKHKQD
jgi:hypothetical protein